MGKGPRKSNSTVEKLGIGNSDKSVTDQISGADE